MGPLPGRLRATGRSFILAPSSSPVPPATSGRAEFRGSKAAHALADPRAPALWPARLLCGSRHRRCLARRDLVLVCVWMGSAVSATGNIWTLRASVHTSRWRSVCCAACHRAPDEAPVSGGSEGSVQALVSLKEMTPERAA